MREKEAQQVKVLKEILAVKRIIPLLLAVLVLFYSPLDIMAAEGTMGEEKLPAMENGASVQSSDTADSETEDFESEKTDTSEPEITPAITLDSEHVYDGMVSSFAKGYMPKITDSSVRVVIPYLANCPLKDNTLTVKADVSSAVACGVTAKSYVKKVKSQTYRWDSVKGGSGKVSLQMKAGEQKESTSGIQENTEEAEVYLYDCNFSIDKERQGGSGPIVLTASGITEEGQEITFTYTIFAVLSKTVTEEESDKDHSNTAPEGGSDDNMGGGFSDNIGSGNNSDSSNNIGSGYDSDSSGDIGSGYDSDSSGDIGSGYDGSSAGGDDSGGFSSGGGASQETEPEVIHQPKIILESCSLSKEKLEAGKSYAISAIFKNCNSKRAISNMKVTLSLDNNNIQFEKTSFYIDSVKAGDSFTVQSKLEIASITDQGNYPVQFNFEYDDVDGNSYSAAETISLAVKQPLNVSLDEAAIPQEVYSTDTISVPVSVINSSRAPLYNVTISLECDGLVPVQSVFLGNMEAGTQMANEMKVYVGSKVEGEKYGETAGVMKLTYQDAYGELNEQTVNMSTTILEPEILKLNVEQAQPETNGWKGMILAVVFIILTGTIVFLALRLKKSKGGVSP